MWISQKLSSAICPKIHISPSVQRSKRRRSFGGGHVFCGHVSRGQVGGYPKISFSPQGEKNFTRSSSPIAILAILRKFMAHQDFVDAPYQESVRHYGASQKFACAIFKDCAPCYHMSQIIAENTSVLGFGATSFNWNLPIISFSPQGEKKFSR